MDDDDLPSDVIMGIRGKPAVYIRTGSKLWLAGSFKLVPGSQSGNESMSREESQERHP